MQLLLSKNPALFLVAHSGAELLSHGAGAIFDPHQNIESAVLFFSRNDDPKVVAEAKMNGFFDGEFRRKPNVSIGGASRKLNKDELLAKAQKEREQRQVSDGGTLLHIILNNIIHN